MLFHIADPYLNFIGNNTTVTFSLSECQAYDLDDGTFQGLIGPGFQYSRVFQTYDSTGSLVVGSSVASKRWETILAFPAQDLSIRVPIGYTDDEGVEDCLLEVTVSIQPTAECGDTYSFTYGPWILEQ
jgi:hypothetical protein